MSLWKGEQLQLCSYQKEKKEKETQLSLFPLSFSLL